MWIFRNDSFLSIVAHKDRPEMLMVRSRADGDLERAFPGCKPVAMDDADYRYRAVISRAEVATAIGEALQAIQYTNFKDSVVSPSRHRAYLEVWESMRQAFGGYGRKGKLSPPQG